MCHSGGAVFLFPLLAAGLAGCLVEPAQVQQQVILDPQHRAPIVSDMLVDALEDQVKLFQLAATDPEGQVLEYYLVTGPSHGQATLNRLNGSVEYISNANFYGEDVFYVNVSDGVEFSNLAKIAILVAPVNDAPIAGPVTVASQQFQIIAGRFGASDVDGDGLDYVVFDAKGQTQWQIAADGFTFMPEPEQVGVLEFAYQAFDGELYSQPASLRFEIAALPYIELIESSEVHPGGTIVIQGQRFGAPTTTATIKLADQILPTAIWTDRYVAVTAPFDLTIGEAKLQLVNQLGASQVVNVRLVPQLTSVMPSDAPAGATAVIYGAGFGDLSGQVYIGGALADVLRWSASAVTIVVPTVAKGEQPVILRTATAEYGNLVKFFVHGSDLWLPAQELSARTGHAVVWTGKEFIVWGGFDGARYLADGARFNPSTGTWLPITLAAAPVGRADFSAVWTGQGLFIWGGRDQNGALADGAIYEPTSDRWEPLPTFNAPSGRFDAVTVRAGDEIVIWGGQNSVNYLGDGARFNVRQNSWQSLAHVAAPTPRVAAAAVWTGDDVLVWGGQSADGVYLNDGGRYNLKQNSWLPLSSIGAPSGRRDFAAAWSGQEFLVWGGFNGAFLQSGGRYDPGNDRWQPMSSILAPSARSQHAAIWQVDRWLIVGGRGLIGATLDAGFYDPIADKWQPLALPDAYTDFIAAGHAWGGASGFIWGGKNNAGEPLSRGLLTSRSGGLLAPATAQAGPERRFDHSAVWTGQEMLVWGGSIGQEQSNTGAVWRPDVGWRQMNQSNAPSARSGHTAVWLEQEMLLAGGRSGQPATVLTDAHLYDPNGGVWRIADSTYDNFDASGAVFFERDSKRLWQWGAWLNQTPIDRLSSLDVVTATARTVESKFAGAASGSSIGYLSDHLIYVWGGQRLNQFLKIGDVFDATLGVWKTRVSDYTSDFQQNADGWLFSGGWYYRVANASWMDLACPQCTGSEVKYHSVITIGSGTEISADYVSVFNCGSLKKFSFGIRGNSIDSNFEFFDTTSSNNSYRKFKKTTFEQLGSSGNFYAYCAAVANCGAASIDNVRFSNVATAPPAIDIVNAPTGRADAGTFSLRDGCFYIWGGRNETGKLGDGKRYCAATRTWSPMSNLNAPSPRTQFAPVWTGDVWFVWGGEGQDGQVLGDGAVFDPYLNQWRKVSSLNAPVARAGHTAIWTGREVVIFGGRDAQGQPLAHMGRYLP